MNWYYALNGTQQGPVPEEQLAQLAAAGTINAATLVWREGLPEWQALSVAMPAALMPASSPQIGGYAVPVAQKDLIVQQMREGVTPAVSGVLDYAGFWIRVGAKIIDGIIFFIGLLLILGIVAGVLYLAGVPISLPDQANPGAPPSVGFIVLIVIYYAAALFGPAVFNAVCLIKWEATPGKLALGLKVVTDTGGRVSTGRAWGRGFAELLSGMTCYIGYIIVGFDDQKRSLHDHICTTRVIRIR